MGARGESTPLRVSNDVLSLGETRTMRLTVRLILALTLDELGIAPREWDTRTNATGRTTRRIARAGQLAAWLAHRNMSARPQHIAKVIGRDYTTVLYALKRVPEILAIDHSMAMAVQRLEERIDCLAMLTEDSAEARALLSQQGQWTEARGVRP
jgi:chromosomal replication initiation ATPase DnaA